MDKDIEAPEITKVLQHQYNGGTLEFLCKYDSGNTEWHPLELVKADDPWSVANYIMQNNLGDCANQIHQRWSCILLQSVWRVQRRMKQSNIFSFYASTYYPTKKKIWSCCCRKLR